MNNIRVENVEINLGKKKITLTIAEMRELKKVLNDTFPEKEVVYIPSAPIIVDRPYWPWTPTYPHWSVTCDSASNTLCLSNS